MARSPLFFRSRRLGTFERATKSERARIGSAADESNRALSTGKSPRLADVARAKSAIELSVTSQPVFDALQSGGALFFTELVRRSGLLPSQVEEALSQLAALGWSLQIVSMDCVRFSFHRTSGPPLVEILQNAGAEKTSRASSLQVAGRCCEGAANFAVATGASNGTNGSSRGRNRKIRSSVVAPLRRCFSPIA